MSNTLGYCAAIADVSRMGEGSIAEELLAEAGFRLEDIIKAGIEEYDLEEIRKLFVKKGSSDE